MKAIFNVKPKQYKMKTKTIYLLLAGVIILMNSCEFYERVVPSGNVITEEKDFSGFDKLDVSNAFTVYVNFSETEESIEIEAEENLHEYIRVRKTGDVLYIGLEDLVNIWGNATLNAYITTSHIDEFTGSGASKFIINDPITAGNVDIDLSGASFFKAQLETNSVNVNISGASKVELEGTTGRLDVMASGASEIKDYDLSVEDLFIDLSGASEAFLTVNNEISVSASGASKLNYKGEPVIVDQHLSGASEVHRR